MKANQLRSFIQDVLRYYFFTDGAKNRLAATELLMLTAAQETHLGEYLFQLGDGPAMGIFQIEPATYEDLFENYLTYREDLLGKLTDFNIHEGNWKLNMKGNLVYQVVIARLIYKRVKEALPDMNSPASMGTYWKNYWNTHLGKGTVQDAVANYLTYCK